MPREQKLVGPLPMLSTKVANVLRERPAVKWAEGARWIYQRLCDPKVKPLDAPDMGTWGLLEFVRSDPVALQDFYKAILASVRSVKAQTDDRDVGLAEADLSDEFDRLAAAEDELVPRETEEPVDLKAVEAANAEGRRSRRAKAFAIPRRGPIEVAPMEPVDAEVG